MAQLLFDDILSGLEAVACPYQIPDLEALKVLLGGKCASKKYAQIVVWLCQQMLQCGGNIEVVSLPNSPDEEPMFRVELSTTLKELGCPVPTIGGAESLTDPNNRTAALHYLVHELMSVQLAALNTDQRTEVNTATGAFSGHPALHDLALIYNILDLPSPSDEDSIEDIFATVVHKMQQILKQNKVSKDELLSDPMLRVSLTPDQWDRFEEVCHTLNDEYSIRFKTLLKRLDLTMTSFKWGKDAKDKAQLIDQVYNTQRRLMNDKSNLTIADVLACRADQLCVPKTSSGSARLNTKSKLNNMVIVGRVPDRGGRPLESRPEPEIPSWLKDKNKRGGGYSQQSRGGQSQAARGNQYQQQPRQDSRNQQGYQDQGYQGGGYDSRRGGGGHYNNRGNRGGGGYRGGANRGGGWGGHRGNNRRGGGIY